LKNICDSVFEFEIDLENEIRFERSIFEKKSISRKYWNGLILFLSMWFATNGIFRIAFFPKEFNTIRFYFEVFSDIVFLIDIVFQFLTPIKKEKKLVYDLTEIAYSYIFGWFLLDLILSAPLNIYLLIYL